MIPSPKALWHRLVGSGTQKIAVHEASKARPTHKKDTHLRSQGAPKIRVVFMGTPELSAHLLSDLLEARYNIVGVVTKPDKPVGRSKTIEESPVKKLALEKSLPLLQPERMDAETLATLTDWKPDLIVVAAYGKILPEAVLSLPGFGCVNFHTSLLPLWRGASPIQNALLTGATETGVTIMLMDKGMDTGDILTQVTVPIAPDDTTATLTEKLGTAGSHLLLETLPDWVERRLTPQKQSDEDATLCQLIERSDGKIVWSDDAESLYNRYRALTPWPGIYCFWRKKDNLLRLKLLTVSVQKMNPEHRQPIGMVSEIGEKVGVQTGNGILFLEEVQLEGKSPMAIRDFLNGNDGFIGTLLE